MPFMMELPAYRIPALVPIARKSVQRAKHFVTKAGAVILGVTVVIWILGYFPNQGADLGGSWLGMLGQWIEPVFQPLGLDWRYGVAIVSAFLAREVFVGTLGTIMGIEGAEDNIVPLVEQVQASACRWGRGWHCWSFLPLPCSVFPPWPFWPKRPTRGNWRCAW